MPAIRETINLPHAPQLRKRQEAFVEALQKQESAGEISHDQYRDLSEPYQLNYVEAIKAISRFWGEIPPYRKRMEIHKRRKSEQLPAPTGIAKAGIIFSKIFTKTTI